MPSGSVNRQAAAATMAFTPLRMVSAEVTSTTETGAGNATTTYDGLGQPVPGLPYRKTC
jgi:hypothetical protein